MMNDEKIRANVYVATPSYGAVIATDYVLGLLDLYDVSTTYGFGLRTHSNSFDSLITRALNTMVAEFLADSRFTHLMWISSRTWASICRALPMRP
jgi:hypothetical protein